MESHQAMSSTSNKLLPAPSLYTTTTTTTKQNKQNNNFKASSRGVNNSSTSRQDAFSGGILHRRFKTATFTLLLVLVTWSCTCYSHDSFLQQWNFNTFSKSRSILSPAVLEVFQVYPPVAVGSEAVQDIVPPGKHLPQSSTSTTNNCTVLLMDHSFGFSYGKPFVVNYNPPNCKFNRVAMNFTVTSQGRQFDRLAIMYFNDTEVWRISTAEPTINGIHWEYIKDMSAFDYFWKSPQKIIFDLGNLVNDVYTGSFNTTLVATFSLVKETLEAAALIIPVTAQKGAENRASVFMIPNDNATTTTSLPRNANRALFSISACGQASEEFWWANVLQSDTDTFRDVTGTLYGFSSFREVQLLIDGQLAGVQWPFPVIFTGGVVPGLWRPIVGIEAFDLREHEIDITPWLPTLSDGKNHSFEIRVVGIDNTNGTITITKSVGDSWYVTGKIFLWLDESSDAVTRGRTPAVFSPDPFVDLSSTITQNKEGANETLAYTTNVRRTISVSSLITTESGSHLVTWTQDLTASNYNVFTNFGANQRTIQKISGTDQSTGPKFYTARYHYPLLANTSFRADSSGNFSLDADLQQSQQLTIQGVSIFSPYSTSALSSTLNGSAHYFASPSARLSTGFGSTSQTLDFKASSFSKPKLESTTTLDQTLTSNAQNLKRTTYYRDVEAVNGTVTKDHESLYGDLSCSSFTKGKYPTVAAGGSVLNPRQAIGRGFGAPRKVLVQNGNDHHG